MVRIGRTSHRGFVQEKTSARGGGAGTVHSAPHSRGPQEREGSLEFKVAVSATPYLSSYHHRLRALLQKILQVFSLTRLQFPPPAGNQPPRHSSTRKSFPTLFLNSPLLCPRLSTIFQADEISSPVPTIAKHTILEGAEREGGRRGARFPRRLTST